MLGFFMGAIYYHVGGCNASCLLPGVLDSDQNQSSSY